MANSIFLFPGSVTTGGITMGGDLLFSPDGTYTIGSSGASRPSNIFASNQVRGAILQYTGSLNTGTALLASNTAPTISSGFGTSPSIVANNGTAAFTINVGTGGVATSGVIGLPAATTGWIVLVQNSSANTATVFLTKQTAFTTTTATIGNYDAAGAPAAWTASNVLVCSAFAF